MFAQQPRGPAVVCCVVSDADFRPSGTPARNRRSQGAETRGRPNWARRSRHGTPEDRTAQGLHQVRQRIDVWRWTRLKRSPTARQIGKCSRQAPVRCGAASIAQQFRLRSPGHRRAEAGHGGEEVDGVELARVG
jgi:hypothetical protein